MIQQGASVIRFLCSAAILSSVACAVADEKQTIRAEVQQAVAAKRSASSDPEQTIYETKYDLRLTNLSGEPINVPGPETGHRDMKRLIDLGTDLKLPSGNWIHLMMGTFLDVGRYKYYSCKELPSGGTALMGDITGGLIVMKEQAAEMGTEPTLRFYLMTCCRGADGKLVFHTVTTEPFGLQLRTQLR